MNRVSRVLHRPEPAGGRPPGSFLGFDLGRGMRAPLESRDAAPTPKVEAQHAGKPQLAGCRATRVPPWLTIEGTLD